MKCKACGTDIEFVLTANNKKMPVNKQKIPVIADSKGKINGITEDGKVVRCSPIMAGTKGSFYVYVSHFATCQKWGK